MLENITDSLYAHTKPNSSERQLLRDHLINVANLSQRFYAEFSNNNNGYWMGLLHDIGKVSEGFQKRLDGGKIVDHSSAGACYLKRQSCLAESMCVAGHHGGLLDIGNQFSFDDGSFLARINNNEEKAMELLKPYIADLTMSGLSNYVTNGAEEDCLLKFCIYVHMLYSCLVDADFLDTESFVTGKSRESIPLNQEVIDSILSKADVYLKTKTNNPIFIERNKILAKCIEAAKQDKGLYSLQTPTGAGKTFSSLAFAAEHIKTHKEIKRIIYVIPYISIIEQTAKSIKEIVGEKWVLEHHSLSNDLVPEADGDDCYKLSTSENWDIPIIITTNEQFFESFFNNKSSKCRKIHNVANSVVIFDEAQMLPVNLLELSVKLIKILVSSYGVTAVLCTATQPELSRFLGNVKPKEIVTAKDFNLDVFKRTQFKIAEQPLSKESLVNMATRKKQSLIIVNTKKTANDVYELLPEESRYILTTNLTPDDRSNRLKTIRDLLDNKKACHLVATSLVEAGVDLDFEVVFREKFGLDSIVQAAGRCNREGKRPFSDSFTYIFELQDKHNLSGDGERKLSSLNRSLRIHDIASSEIIKTYFELYYTDAYTEECSEYVKKVEYKTLGEKFKLIDDASVSVIIKNPKIESILQRLEDGDDIHYSDRKLLSFHSVRCRKFQFYDLFENGAIYYLGGNEEYPVLRDTALYDDTGLRIPEKIGDVTW